MKRVVLDKSQVIDIKQVAPNNVYGALLKDGSKIFTLNHDFIRDHLEAGNDVFEFYSVEEFDEWFEQE